MGNQKSQEKKQFDLQINHPRLSNAKVITQDNQKLLQITSAVDEKEYDKWKLALAKHKLDPSVLLLPRSDSFSRKGLCGNTGTLQINFDNYPYLLTEQIYNKKGKKSKFSEQELWYLLYSLVVAKKQLREVHENIGDIRPLNIFLNEEGRIKVANLYSWPLQTNNIQKSLQKVVTYLAPQDIQKLHMGSLEDNPSQASEIFSIGLTLLGTGLLRQLDSLYNLNSFEFDTKGLQQNVNSWKQTTYSQVLRSTVSNLLHADPQKRMTLDQLIFLLAKHEENINKKVDFFIDNAPDKLHEEVQKLRASFHPVSFHSNLITSEYRIDRGQEERLNHP